MLVLATGCTLDVAGLHRQLIGFCKHVSHSTS